MPQNKLLVIWISSIFGATILLVAGVIAHDRQIDKCIVDHLFDFHLDSGRIRELAEEDKTRKEIELLEKKEAEKRNQQWADEVRSFWDNSKSSDNDRGTQSESDSRDCNRDR